MKISNVDDLINVLQYHTVLVEIEIFSEFYNPKGGYYIPMPQLGRSIEVHAVVFMEYFNKEKCFCFANSWEKNWGRGGYGLFPYDYVKRYMVSAWVIKGGFCV